METDTKKITQSVLDRIRSGEVSMRSKGYFMLRAALLIVVAGLTFLVAISLAAFISFDLRISGHESLLGFGSRGLSTFLALFPWPLAVVGIGLVLLLSKLLQEFRLGYRRSFALLLLAFALAAALIGLLVDRATPFEDDLFERAEQGALPAFVGDAYSREHRIAPHEKGVFRGRIASIGDISFSMTYDDFDGDEDEERTWTVILPPGFSTSTLIIGARAYVAGDADEGVIRAYGIRILPEP